ncbi:aminotransferase class IV [Parvibaculum lavamentivorans DS-1]|uniref:Probable branched-chain-amino-acid aminotransferase n=1 Tax=Parvibaculum lavamentivorans (strain DS-1 / DSM 13023 / NCIMB 13966) TaxID=402881 RepID=A7HTE8_PARL1|nr:aminotransferase class IV [Parvibaculum lavamentivorans]ABS63181.1 aminotransferase class IV [Parvibaculum lavamentivorans DS-1]
MKIWLSGAIMEAEAARIDPADRGFLLGDGLFETMLARNGHISFFEEHLMRLVSGADMIGIEMPFGPVHVEEACKALLEENKLDSAPRASLRLTLTRGPGPRGLALPANASPTVMISCAAAPNPPERLNAIIATPRRNPWSPAARLKALPYLDNVLAKEEARMKGADEALMLETSGNLACASAANIFLWEGERLITPSERCGILPGITRAALLELAPDMGIETSEDEIAPARIAHASGAFLTNCLMGLVPLARIDGRVIPAHPMTARLAAAYELLLDAADEND